MCNYTQWVHLVASEAAAVAAATGRWLRASTVATDATRRRSRSTSRERHSLPSYSKSASCNCSTATANCAASHGKSIEKCAHCVWVQCVHSQCCAHHDDYADTNRVVRHSSCKLADWGCCSHSHSHSRCSRTKRWTGVGFLLTASPHLCRSCCCCLEAHAMLPRGLVTFIIIFCFFFSRFCCWSTFSSFARTFSPIWKANWDWDSNSDAGAGDCVGDLALTQPQSQSQSQESSSQELLLLDLQPAWAERTIYARASPKLANWSQYEKRRWREVSQIFRLRKLQEKSREAAVI